MTSPNLPLLIQNPTKIALWLPLIFPHTDWLFNHFSNHSVGISVGIRLIPIDDLNNWTIGYRPVLAIGRIGQLDQLDIGLIGLVLISPNNQLDNWTLSNSN